MTRQMAKQILLLVDDDDRRRRVLEVSLRNAGFAVVSVGDGSEALAQALGAAPGQTPALVLSNTRLPGLDGFALCDRIKTDPGTTEMGFVFLSDDARVEARMRGLELGADDYLTRPIYIQELLARIGVVLQRRARERLAQDGTARTFGALEALGPVDLLLTLNRGRKTGVLRVEGRRPLTLWLEAGEVVDAEAGLRLGEEVVYRFLSLAAGRFSVSSELVARPRRVVASVEALVNEGMRRLEAWGRTAEQLPGLETVFAVDHGELAERQTELPPAILELLRLFDGRRTAVEVVDDAGLPALDALVAVARLYFEGLLYEERRLATPAPEPGSGGRDLSAWLAQARTGAEGPGRTGAEGHWPPEPLGMSATGMSALGLLSGTPPPSPGTQAVRPSTSLPPPAPASALSDLPGPLPPVDARMSGDFRSPGDFVRALPSVPPPVVAPPSLGPRSMPPTQSTGPLPTLPITGPRDPSGRATGAVPAAAASAGPLGAAQPSLVDALLSTASQRPALLTVPADSAAPVSALPNHSQTAPAAEQPSARHGRSDRAAPVPGPAPSGPGVALAPTPPPVSAVGGLPVMGVPATPAPPVTSFASPTPNLHDAPVTPQPGLLPADSTPLTQSGPVAPPASLSTSSAGAVPKTPGTPGTPGTPAPAVESRAITDSADELSFFNPRPEEHPEELPEEHHGGALGTPAYIALGLVGAIAVAAALFFGLRDTVAPRLAPKDALRRDWHSAVLATRAPASAPPLVADWRPPANPDAPALPPQEAPPAPDAPAPDAPAPEAPAPGAPAPEAPAQPLAADRPPTDRPPADGVGEETEPARPGAAGDFDALMGEGMGLHDKRQYGKAAARFRKAVAARPSSEPALIALANALIEEGQEKEALKTALSVARINPSNARAHLIIGSVRQNQGQKEAAIEAYERYLSLAPTGELAREVQRVLDGMRPETPR